MRRLALLAAAVAALALVLWLALRPRGGAEPGTGSVPAARPEADAPPPALAPAPLEGTGRAAGDAPRRAATAEEAPEKTPEPAPTGRATLLVKVRGPDGTDVAARVSVRDAAGKESATDVAAGAPARFEIAPGEARVDVAAPGLVLDYDAETTVEDGKTSVLVLSLETGASLEGRVVAAKDGLPVAGAWIDVRGGGAIGHTSASGGRASYGRIRSDADGRFKTAGLPFDFIVTLSVEAAGFRRHEQATIVHPVEGERPPIEVRLEPGGRLRGIVVDAQGKPAAGARVRVVPQGASREIEEVDPASLGAVADADGAFVVEGLGLGVVYVAAAFATGHAPSRPAAGVEVTERRPEARVDLVLGRFGAIVLRVLGPSGEAIAAGTATLRLGHDDGIPLGPDGRVVFEGLAAGRYDAEVRAPGFVPAGAEIELSEGERVDRSVRLERGHALGGVVVDDLDTPVAKAGLAFSRGDGDEESLTGTETDARGRFRAEDLPAGLVSVSVQKPDLTPATLENVPVPGPDVRIVLRRAGRVVARFVTPAGVPAPARRMVADYALTGSGGGGSGEWGDGRVVWNVPAGTRNLHVSAPGLAPWERQVEVSPGETLDLGDVTLDVGVEIAGRVTNADGRPLGGVAVALEVQGGARVQTDAEGRFRLSNAPKRPVRLVAEADGFVPTGVTVDGSALPNALVVRLTRGGRLVATLRDAAGAPVRDVRVHVAPPDPSEVGAPGRWAWSAPDAKGVVVATLAAGAYRLDVLKDGTTDLLLSKDVTLEEGKETAVEVVVPRE